MKLDELKEKRVLILGFGREGRDTFLFLRKVFPKKIFGIADKLSFEKFNSNTKKILSHILDGRLKCGKLYLGKNYLKALKKYDIIIKSPGVPAKILRKFRRASQIITSQTEIFFENCPGKIVGVTGTKGKSTTATLIYKVLKEEGIRAHLVGNIGKPVLNLLFSATKKDVYVYELSSHQLYNLKKSPQIAVFLNIYPEHGDYYKNFKEYLRAKQNICRYQTKNDYFIYNREDKNVRKTAKISKAKKIPVKIRSDQKFSDRRKSGQIYGIKIKDIPSRVRVNLLNAAVAIKVAEIFKIPKEKIKKAIREFRPLPHRLEFIGTFKGIKFYNDSLATVPEATIKAINTLGKNLETIILGGFERKQDFKNLAKKILKSNIKILILFPVTGQRILKQIKSCRGLTSTGPSTGTPAGTSAGRFIRGKKILKHFFVNDMKEAVKLAYQYTKRGKICLLSPASASFNLFKDYKERGNLFKKFVKILGR